MGLDLVILGADGRPTRGLSLTVEDHDHLMRLACGTRNSIWLRMSDYYSDTEFAHFELDQLIAEAEAQRALVPYDDRLAKFLSEIVALATEAKGENQHLVVIAD